jgi:hypothetical protein
MQALGETYRQEAFDVDPDHWLTFNCRYCKNIATCGLYKGLVNMQERVEFTSTTICCPWLRVTSSF